MNTPPVAERRDHTETIHGVELSDPYHWLKDQSYPKVDDEDVLAYLKAENAHFEQVMAPLQSQVNELFEEIKARQVEDESSVPVRDREYMYQSRFLPNQQYHQHVRWPVRDGSLLENLTPPANDVQIVLDENILAEATSYFQLRGFSIDPSHSTLAFGMDDSGTEQFTLRFLNINKGTYLPESMAKVTGEVVWATDSNSLFYVVNNNNWRPYRVMRHTLGTASHDDAVVYEEHDEGFFVGIDQSTSRKFLIVNSASNVTSEVRTLALDNAFGELTLIAGRKDLHAYDVDHHQDEFVIRTNDIHKNFRLVVAPETTPSVENWLPLLEPSDERYVTHATSFESNTVIAVRENGLETFLILDADGATRSVPFSEAVYSLGFGDNPEPDPDFLRIEYSSLATPETTFDYEFATGKLHSRKVQQIPSGHDPSQYVTERVFVNARDGMQIPVSIVYRKGTPRDGSAPLYLYAYGAYGSTVDPYFRTTILSLLNRGFVYAIAHIRGGSELGYAWYEDGKLDKRTNTFDDFVDVARHLVASQYTSKGHIAIAGGSAGGSLMGAAVNAAPDLWGAVAAHVPFVDILNTMLDTSLPLTPIEWPEWGNPIESKEDFAYIRSYSPYDQLQANHFPPLFVTAGLNDPRVTYWEPAKWVAKIRHLKLDENPLVLRTEMSAGHGGKSGRYDSLRDVADEYAFILHAMGLLE